MNQVGETMQLQATRIREFQSIRDSREFRIGDITCLVGKNEAGKTALLKALYRLNPIVDRDGVFDLTSDYPRRDVEDYQYALEAGEIEPVVVVWATFDLERPELDAIEAAFGPSVLRSPTLELSKGYSSERSAKLSVSVGEALAFLVGNTELPLGLVEKLAVVETVAQALEEVNSAEQTTAVVALDEKLVPIQSAGGLQDYIVDQILEPWIPKFLYFDEYYEMKGSANIQQLVARENAGALNPSDYPLLGLLELARLNLDSLLNPRRTRELKNKLEGAGNHLTKRVIKYWSQNRHLQLRFDVRPAQPDDPEGMQKGTNLWGDVFDSKHLVTTEIGTRSRGFVWFFSFLAWYSRVSQEGAPVILLLDEPGVSLHAKAQEDLLRYFDAEVLGHNQLIYSTHSPFMVDAGRFDRVRVVQDQSVDQDVEDDAAGTQVLSDVLEASDDTLFPLQGALGYEIHQTLFVGPNSLVVEGVSDLLYLQVMSSLLVSAGRNGLDPKWTITPVGGSDKVSTFVALIGARTELNVAALVDFQSSDQQMLENLYKRRLIEKKKVVTYADFLPSTEADVEDMFEPLFYLSLFNAEYSKELAEEIDIQSLNMNVPRMVRRIELALSAAPLREGRAFNHFRPARYLAENTGTMASKLGEDTMVRFEALFERLNSLL
jgi:predicted ATPase